jgi:hypothetical protein
MALNEPTEIEELVDRCSENIHEIVDEYDERSEGLADEGTMYIHEQLCQVMRVATHAAEYTSDPETECKIFGEEEPHKE